MSTTHSANSSHVSRMQATFDSVNWDALSALACRHYKVEGFHWGDQLWGGYNLVRFLHLHDDSKTVLVARVPLHDVSDKSAAKHRLAISNRVASEIAIMEYIESQTNIPIPHIIESSANAESIGSPFILMTKVDGVPLVQVWDEMADDKRRVLLQQVVDILLELWSHRFDTVGALFKQPNGKWTIASSSSLDDSQAGNYGIDTTSHSNAADYWLAYTNAKLQAEKDFNFGDITKSHSYAMLWFMRSLIPALFDPSVDRHGFPLSPGDLHSQNIMVTDIDTPTPHISAVIDWEFSGSDYCTSFAHYPFFIIDHPAWEDDHPLRPRNVRDQATFDELLREAERKRGESVGGVLLSDLISKSYTIYLFNQCVRFEIMFGVLYPCLFEHVFGPGSSESGGFSTDYYEALMESGILRKESERFNIENEVFLKSQEVLGEDAIHGGMTRQAFKEAVSAHSGRFDENGVVHQWLNSEV
ncbi:hypothetical protein VKT23_002674 [Stygiomarasmius scandens]|uniref:Aminoglycoside phosphotransferase domain-containing protein n=1 Tax=Marasmiellus scandens TaxID=2682957 RepID=A0ABR1K2Q3_9AGAR